jgi:predicted metal-dependent peptidase
MKFVEEKGIPTMGVDAKGTCYYNTDFVNSLSDQQLMGTLCHEIMHCALLHLSRGKKLNGQIYNISADLVINDMVTENGLELPTEGLIPYNHKYTLKLPDGQNLEIEDINKRSAESIYTQIKNAWNQQDGSGSGQGNGEWEKGFDEHRYGDSGDQELQARDDDFWKNKVVESAMASKMAGKSPLGMGRIIDEITNPKMSWQQLLQKYVRAKIPYDFTWRRPSKKSYSTGVYLPNVEKTGIEIIFMIDTSGSMSEKELKECFGEINGIVKSIQGVSLKILYHDTKVYEGSILKNPTEQDIIKELKNIKGGGGTDFKTAYTYLEEHFDNADVIVHLSDGYDSFPKTFSKPLIICLQSNGKDIEEVEESCPYAKVIKIKGE